MESKIFRTVKRTIKIIATPSGGAPGLLRKINVCLKAIFANRLRTVTP
jgi:hypothetical protein